MQDVIRNPSKFFKFFMLLSSMKIFLYVSSEMLEDAKLIDWLVDPELIMVAK